MTITNLAAFDSAIRAVCPNIDGVDATGFIFFQPSATAQQKSAAATAAAAYVDPPPAAVPDLHILVQTLASKGVLSPSDVSGIMTTPPTPPRLARSP